MQINLTTIILFVQDVDRLKKFYNESLQLRITEEIPGEWVVLAAGSCNIGLHKVGMEHSVASPKKFSAESNTKFVFETEDDINELRAQLINNYISVGEIKMFPGYDYWLCDGEDPEGNVFQIREKKRG